jgi:hypothetical protein
MPAGRFVCVRVVPVTAIATPVVRRAAPPMVAPDVSAFLSLKILVCFHLDESLSLLCESVHI